MTVLEYTPIVAVPSTAIFPSLLDALAAGIPLGGEYAEHLADEITDRLQFLQNDGRRCYPDGKRAHAAKRLERGEIEYAMYLGWGADLHSMDRHDVERVMLALPEDLMYKILGRLTRSISLGVTSSTCRESSRCDVCGADVPGAAVVGFAPDIRTRLDMPFFVCAVCLRNAADMVDARATNPG
jgi:hypothetical protein